jgi:hypothetical protein
MAFDPLFLIYNRFFFFFLMMEDMYSFFPFNYFKTFANRPHTNKNIMSFALSIKKKTRTFSPFHSSSFPTSFSQRQYSFLRTGDFSQEMLFNFFLRVSK